MNYTAVLVCAAFSYRNKSTKKLLLISITLQFKHFSRSV